MSRENDQDRLFELELEEQTRGMHLGDAETFIMKARIDNVDEKSRQSAIRSNLRGVAIALLFLGANQLFPDLIPEKLDGFVNTTIIIGGISLIALTNQLHKK